MTLKRARSASPDDSTDIYRSAVIEDRHSRFVAAFSPTLSAKSLQQLPDFQSATHRITAWRVRGAQRTLDSQPVFETGWDDDGESYGGKTLEKVLTAKGTEGTVVVARWYGGVMLGPVRFDHLRDCAGDAIAQWAQAGSKKVKSISNQERLDRLVETLTRRDQSILVLRALLAEKTGAAASAKEPVGPAKGPDYCKLDLFVLERLEQVRDKTIGWLLEQIERAEAVEAEAARRGSPTVDSASQMQE